MGELFNQGRVLQPWESSSTMGEFFNHGRVIQFMKIHGGILEQNNIVN